MNPLILLSYFNALASCRNAKVTVISCRGFWQVWATRETRDPGERPNSVSVYRAFKLSDSKNHIARQAASMGESLEYMHTRKAYDHNR